MIRILSLQNFSAKESNLSLRSFSSKKINQLEFYNPQIVFRAILVQDFTSSSTWTCPEGVSSIEYLIVAGGGGGGEGR